MSAKAQLKAERDQARADKKRIAELERELRRKDILPRPESGRSAAPTRPQPWAT